MQDVRKGWVVNMTFLETPDLSKSFNPQPKPLAKVKMPKAVNKQGKKTKSWTDKRNELKIEFAKMKIFECELKRKGCWHNTALGFAHAKKRRKLTIEDLKTVILVCNPCHSIIEPLQPEVMEKIVIETMAKRKGTR